MSRHDLSPNGNAIKDTPSGLVCQLRNKLSTAVSTTT